MNLFQLTDAVANENGPRQRGISITHGGEGCGAYLRDMFIPLSSDLSDIFEATQRPLLYLEHAKLDPAMVLHRASRAEIENKRRQYGSCLVHVCPEGGMRLASRQLQDELEGRRVVRRPIYITATVDWPSFATGVEPLYWSADQNELLATMAPGAGFMYYTETQRVRVNWSGLELFVDAERPPRQSRRPPADRAPLSSRPFAVLAAAQG